MMIIATIMIIIVHNNPRTIASSFSQYTINNIFTIQELLLKVRSRTLYHVYTASIIAAVGMSMISIANLNTSPAILPSAAFAAQQQQTFTAKMTGSEEVPPKILRQEEQPNLFSAQMARP
jgi:hypothetical protein